MNRKRKEQPEALFNNLKKLCEKKGITLTKLTRDIGVNKNAPWDWKAGNGPSDGVLLKLKEYFGIKASDLLSYPSEIAEKLMHIRYQDMIPKLTTEGIDRGIFSPRNLMRRAKVSPPAMDSGFKRNSHVTKRVLLKIANYLGYSLEEFVKDITVQNSKEKRADIGSTTLIHTKKKKLIPQSKEVFDALVTASKKKGLKLSQVISAVNLCSNTYFLWQHGIQPRVSNVRKVTDYLGINIQDIFKDYKTPINVTDASVQKIKEQVKLVPEKRDMDLTRYENELVSIFRRMSVKEQTRVMSNMYIIEEKKKPVLA